jgi:hypothetical protein
MGSLGDAEAADPKNGRLPKGMIPPFRVSNQ